MKTALTGKRVSDGRVLMSHDKEYTKEILDFIGLMGIEIVTGYPYNSPYTNVSNGKYISYPSESDYYPVIYKTLNECMDAAKEIITKATDGKTRLILRRDPEIKYDKPTKKALASVFGLKEKEITCEEVKKSTGYRYSLRFVTDNHEKELRS